MATQTVKLVPDPRSKLRDVLAAAGKVGFRVMRQGSSDAIYGEIPHGKLIELRGVPGVGRVETLSEIKG